MMTVDFNIADEIKAFWAGHEVYKEKQASEANRIQSDVASKLTSLGQLMKVGLDVLFGFNRC